MDGWIVGWMDGLWDGWMNGWMDEGLDGWVVSSLAGGR